MVNRVRYNKLKKLEVDITKKLFNYITENIDLNDILDELDGAYSYFYETDNNTAFNIWLSLDYLDKKGKSFAEKFLEDNKKDLTSYEKVVLEERNKSYVSLFKILAFKDDQVYIRDIFRKKDFLLIEPELSKVISEGEFVFSRIGKGLGHYTFIGDINFLPKSYRYDFIKEVLIDFNHTRVKHKQLTIKNYLKRFCLNIYGIYDEIIASVSDDDNVESYRLDGMLDINSFEIYLSSKMEEEYINLHLLNLSHIINFYVVGEKENYRTLKDIDIEDFLSSAIEDGFITIRNDFLSYIETLKLYFASVKDKDPKYKDSFNKISTISKSPFKYIREINSHEIDLYLDEEFEALIEDDLNYKALSFVSDFDLFLSYINSKGVTLTEKSKKIKRKYLLELNNSFKNKTYPESKSPNQKDFINIDFFYKLALELNLIYLPESMFSLNYSAFNYLNLDNYKKYIIIFKYLFNRIIEDDFQKRKDFLLNKLALMKPLEDYSYNYFLMEDDNLLDSYGHFLKLLGIIIYNKNEKDTISITSLGANLSHYNRNLNKDNIIDLKNISK